MNLSGLTNPHLTFIHIQKKYLSLQPLFSDMKNLYILAGCNGAGKTTAAFHLLPGILQCKEFVNADEIARGISPFQPEKATFEAGKIMTRRIEDLMNAEKSFAIETTLAAISYLRTVRVAQKRGYYVTLIFFWLPDVELAKARVRLRVQEGGHSVPEKVIERRFRRGIVNFFDHFLPLCDNVMVFNNASEEPKLVMAKTKDKPQEIFDNEIYNQILISYEGNRNSTT